MHQQTTLTAVCPLILSIRQAVPIPSTRRKGIKKGKPIAGSDMTTLEWVLIAVVVLLVLLLIPCIYVLVCISKAFDAVMPKFPSKSLWQTIVDKLRQVVKNPIHGSD